MASHSRTRKVLLAVDGSENSEYAFDWYVSNMHKEENSLLLIHIPETFANVTMMSPEQKGDVNRPYNEYLRRCHSARTCNLLLKSALKPLHDWVLWMDVGVKHVPTDIIQQLLSAQKDVVTPLGLFKRGHRRFIYDKKTWRETAMSLSQQKGLPKGEVMMEGYWPTKRLWLSDLRGEGKVVRLDGVGAVTLLVRADCFRKGLEFPEKLYELHVESEGLAKMARKLGFQVYGMPFVEVFH